MDLVELVTEYNQLRTERRMLEAKAAEIKMGRELELQSQILTLMAEAGFKTVKLDGVGTITTVEKDHYEIADQEVVARTLFKSMMKAAQEGRPFSDGIFLQMRLSKAAVEELGIGTDEKKDGIRKASKPDLSIRRA